MEDWRYMQSFSLETPSKRVSSFTLRVICFNGNYRCTYWIGLNVLRSPFCTLWRRERVVLSRESNPVFQISKLLDYLLTNLSGFTAAVRPCFACDILSLFQNYENQNQFLKFASLFIGAITLIAIYCWFGQQVIDEVSSISYMNTSLSAVHNA